MAATTLVTFLLEIPSSARTVDVLGSWDNFKEPYPLQPDQRAGSGHWRGCHTFKNIICDGKHLDASLSRNGGLKMGGTYWYFYRLDDNFEQHDSSKPSTTACPLLPGQQVNVLEVPSQSPQADQPPRPQTFLESLVFTLDPEAKFKPPRPPRSPAYPDTRRRAHASPQSIPTDTGPVDCSQRKPRPPRCSTASARTLNPLERTKACEHVPPLERARPSTSQGPCISLPKTASLKAIFQKMRGTRSAPSSSGAQGTERSEAYGPISETVEEYVARPYRGSLPDIRASRVRAPLNTPEHPAAATQAEQLSLWTAHLSLDKHSLEKSSQETTNHNPFKRGLRTASRQRVSHDSINTLGDVHSVQAPQRPKRTSSSLHASASGRSSAQPDPAVATSGATVGNIRSSDDTTARNRDSEEQRNSQQLRIKDDCLNAFNRASSPLLLPNQAIAPSPNHSLLQKSTATPSVGLQRPTRPPSLLHDSRETLENFYSSSSSCGGGPLSPHYLSQPESPSVRDYEEAWDSESQTRAGSQDALSPNDQPSSPLDGDDDHDGRGAPMLDLVLPMPHLPSPGFQGYSLPETECGSTLTLRKPQTATASDALVQSWNDGSGDHPRMKALDEVEW